MIMATINDKLTYLAGTKDAIKQAIINKGVSVSDSDTFRSYASKINDIESGGSATFPEGIKFGYSTFTEVPMYDTSNMTDMSNMFYYCTKLTTVPLFDASNVNYMPYMFYYCSELTTVPLFDTSNVRVMRYMFRYCSRLTTVPQFNTNSVTDMSYMFSDCSRLTTVPQFNTNSVTDMSSMFSRCSSLTTVPQFNTSNVNYMSSIFYNCSELTTLGGFTGLKINLDLSSSSKLTVESVMNVINQAADMTNSPKTLTLHANVYAQLSEEQIATATAKGWNIAEK